MSDIPNQITIPTPMYTPRLRGAQARGPHALGVLGVNMRLRISRQEIDEISEVASMLNMTKAAYIRWCATEVAKAIKSADTS